jgi:membrane protein YqaA with SNARE-associated domain
MGYLRRLYHWVLHWAETSYGLWALFILAFAESSFFPIPPDVLLIALVLGTAENAPKGFPQIPASLEKEGFLKGLRQWGVYFSHLTPWFFSHGGTLARTFLSSSSCGIAIVCSLGSLLGGIVGYGIGHFLWYGTDGTFSSLAVFFFSVVPGFSEEAYYAMQRNYAAWDFWVVFTAGFTPIPYKLITITAGVFDINFLMFCVASITSRSARFFLVAFLVWLFGLPIRAFIDRYFNVLCFVFLALLILGFIAIKLLV